MDWRRFVGTGYEGRGVCRWCGGDFRTPRQRTFCSTHCRDTYFSLFAWPDASKAALRRAHHCCERCGMSAHGLLWFRRQWHTRRYPYTSRHLEVHHRVPMNGEDRQYSILNLPYNLVVLCPDCHDAARGEFNNEIAEWLWLDRNPETDMSGVEKFGGTEDGNVNAK